MDFQALKSELTTDPVSVGYTTMSDAQILASLNAETIEISIDVPIGTLEGMLRLNGIVSKLEAYGTTAGQSDALTAARELTGLVGSSNVRTVTMSDPTVAAKIENYLIALVAASQLSDDDQAAILSLAQGKTSRAVQLFGRAVDYGDLQTARSGS